MWPVYDIIEAIMTSLIIKNADMRMLVATLIGARKFTRCFYECRSIKALNGLTKGIMRSIIFG